MNRNQLKYIANSTASDDTMLYAIRRSLSGGMNNRQEPSEIGENQAEVLYNVDISVSGETSKRLGSVLIGNDVGAATPVTLHNFTVQGGTDQLLMYEDTDLQKWEGSGNWASLKNNFTAATVAGIVSCKESGVSPDDVVIVQNETDNAFRFDSAGNAQDLGDTNTSPPKTSIMCWYGNRVWCLLNDLLYFSDAYSADYSGAFDRTTDIFRVPVGKGRALLPTRDLGIIVGGDKEIWSLSPSLTPDPTTDQPIPLIPEMGIVSKKAMVAWGDDVYFFAQDGFRALKRTMQDKLQMGATFPLSYVLKEQYANISWANIDHLSMEVFDNKIFIAVPTSATAYDTWVYHPILNAFVVIQGWSPACWAKYKVGGEERLYYGKQGDGKVYRAWYGYTDEGTTTTDGTAINYQEEGRKEDCGQPLVRKRGGEVLVRAKRSGNHNIDVSISFNDGGYNLLGQINLYTPLVTFPTTFPVVFSQPATVSKKFHLDNYEEWYHAQIKLQHNATNSTNDITVYERTLTAYPSEYINEEV